MFCRACGEDNTEHSIYCVNDGVLLINKTRTINLRKDNTSFCKDCGQASQSYDIYCSNCGQSLYEKTKQSSIKEVSNLISSKKIAIDKNIAGKFNIKRPLIQSFSAFGIIFLIGLIISSGINMVIQEGLASVFDLPVNIKLVNFLDIGLLLNIVNLKFSLLSEYYNIGSATLTGVPFLFVLIPFLVFFIMGIRRGKINKSLGEAIDLKEFIFTALFYGIILSIISLMASIDRSTYIPYIGEQISFQKKYILSTAFFNGTLISSLSLLLGYGLYWKISKDDSLVGNFKYLFDASFIFLSGLVVVSLAVLVYFKIFLNDNLLNNFGDFFIIGQFGIYTFLMINFGSFTLAEDFFGDQVSLFKNISEIKYTFGNGSVVFLYMAILIPFILFFIYGNKAKKDGKNNIIYTSIVYSLLVGILAYLSFGKLMGTGSEGILDEIFSTRVSIGFKFIYSIIGSFILSIGSALAGYFLSKDGKKEVLRD